jgi:hypothetical protein
MKINSVIAYEGGDNKIYYAEVIDSFKFWNGENGLRIIPFGEKYTFDIFESDAWLLADNL